MLVATFWHADAERAARCVERETRNNSAVNRVLQWNLGRMGVITRFYIVDAYKATVFSPMCMDYWTDLQSKHADIIPVFSL